MRRKETIYLTYSGPFYSFRGYRFEIVYHGGPVAIKSRGSEQRITYPKGFWAMWDKFEKLTKDQRGEFEIDPWVST